MSAAESLREFRRGELSIVCLPVFSQSFLPVLLQPFLARYPEVSLTIVPQESPLLEVAFGPAPRSGSDRNPRHASGNGTHGAAVAG